MSVGLVLKSNAYGLFEIIEIIDIYDAKVRFIETGYETVSSISNLKKGKVKDKLSPSVHGVGFIGDGPYKVRVNKKITKSYACWAAMIQRCYDKNFQIRYPTYSDCKVHKDWHNFQVFSEWFYKNYIEGYHLDKDIKFDGNKIYSSETCLFVSEMNNIEKAQAKSYSFISPEGVKVDIYNLNKFCIENKINKDGLYKLHRGDSASYKGWKKA